jgi:hypothetical protein
MVITGVTVEIPMFGACAACVAVKLVHSLHTEGCKQANKYLKQVHIDVAGLIEVHFAGGKAYEYVIMLYTRPRCLKSKAVASWARGSVKS